jgi:nucleotide-binding universal stress UspA family protein
MRVLMATDGSADALAAAQWLRNFPLPSDTEVSVLSVASVPPSPIGIATVEQFKDAVRASARQAAESARLALQPRWPRLEVHVVDSDAFGDPREPILRACQDVDLVVLGARGLSAVKSFFLGSVTIAVARHAPCSVLVAKGEPRPVRHAIIGIDGSEGAASAVHFMAGLGTGLRAVEVTLLGVIEEVRYPSTAPSPLRRDLRAALNELHQERRAGLERVVTAAGTALKPEVARLEVTVDLGQPGAALVAAANRPGCDLVVVGARGLGALERLVLGSVSERVLRHARCPVLIVKRPSPR